MTRMPAEWEPHEATWLAWPYGNQSFEGKIPEIERAYVSMLQALTRAERVRLIVRPEQAAEIAGKLEGAGIPRAQVDITQADYADVWARDWGPTFVEKDGKRAFVKWTYNAYGNKFPELLKDNDVPGQVPMLKSLEKIEAGFVMEGGAIETNGAGVILTTEECLLNPNRNPGMSKEEYERHFKKLLGAEKVVWLKRGLVNDHTDGHIDEIARFVASDTIAYAWEEQGENHELMAENLEILKKTGFKLIPLPLPEQSLPSSYCNFYIGNGTVLVPQFGDPCDAGTLDIIGRAFPSRTIIGIDSSGLSLGGGGVHCVTQQEPTQ